MFVVDSSVWVSRFVPEDEQHDTSRRWLDSQYNDEISFVEPAIVLPEVAGPVSRRTGRAQAGRLAAMLLERLPNVELVAVEGELGRQAALVAADLRIRGADAVYVSLAHRLGFQLVTWDKQQLERGGELISVWRPSELE